MTLQTIEVPLTVYYLEPTNEDLWQTDVLVYRVPCDTEARPDATSMKEFDKKQKMKRQKSGSKQVGNSSGKQSLLAEWKGSRHLFK